MADDRTHTFELRARGPFSLSASSRFLEGFAPAAYDKAAGASLDMAFCLDGNWLPAGVSVTQDGPVIRGIVHGAGAFGPDMLHSAARQVERILSLDVDGSGFLDVGRADPVIGGLQPAYPGLRPVCFWSPYEAAAWAIIGQRVRIVQAAAIKARIAAKHGVRVATGEHTRHAFPSPAALLEVDAFPRLTPEKIQRLHAVARCALEGGLDAGMLRSLKREDALAHLRTIHGIGPFSAELILLRGAGDPDHVPTAEPRLARAIALAYGLDHHPGPEEVLSISRAWAPYRTWVALLLRNHLEAETHEIANGGRRRSTVPRP